MFGLQRANTPS